MTTKRVLLFLLSVFLILSALAWGALFWPVGVFPASEAFHQTWIRSSTSLFMLSVLMLFFLTIGVFVSLEDNFAQVCLAICAVPILPLILIFGTIIQGCIVTSQCP